MDGFFFNQLVDALTKGDTIRFFRDFAIVLLVIWEIRGLKKEVAKISKTIANSFAEGETRFSKLEGRLTTVETQLGGQLHG